MRYYQVGLSYPFLLCRLQQLYMLPFFEDTGLQLLTLLLPLVVRILQIREVGFQLVTLLCDLLKADIQVLSFCFSRSGISLFKLISSRLSLLPGEFLLQVGSTLLKFLQLFCEPEGFLLLKVEFALQPRNFDSTFSLRLASATFGFFCELDFSLQSLHICSPLRVEVLQRSRAFIFDSLQFDLESSDLFLRL